MAVKRLGSRKSGKKRPKVRNSVKKREESGFVTFAQFDHLQWRRAGVWARFSTRFLVFPSRITCPAGREGAAKCDSKWPCSVVWRKVDKSDKTVYSASFFVDQQ